MMVQPTQKVPKILEIKAAINNVDHNAILDTGSSYNFISHTIVSEKDIKSYPIKPIKAELVNGAVVTAEREVKLIFYLGNNENHEYEIRAEVLPSMDPIIILGMEFLIENKTNIDLNEMEITIGSKKFKITSFSPVNELDNKIDELSKIYNNVDKEFSEELKSLLHTNDALVSNVGLIPETEHKIELTEEKPISMKAFRIPLRIKEKTLSLINTLIKDEIIRPSTSKFSSAAFPILKKNGDVRLVVDYRQLNKITKPDHYIFPQIWDLLIQLKGSKVFSKIDLKSGYYQIKMHEKSQKYTAFVIENQKYEWRRMPFGLTNAPKTFQKAMDRFFGHLDFVKVYLDDIIIHSSTTEAHENHLITVMSILNENNIKININKCEFFKEKVIFLGHQISETGIGINESLVKNFLFKKPKNKRGIQKLLGFLNYFKSFIKEFSKKTLFLTDMLRSKQINIHWNPEHTNMYIEILRELLIAPVLTYPDPDQEFILETDASDRAIGAVLKQKKTIVAFYSHKFSSSVEKYTSMEKEALRILKSLIFFRPYVIGSKIIIYTDNRNLLFESDLTKRVQRWKILLEEFNYELRRIEGKQNKIADTISRLATIIPNKQSNYWSANDHLIKYNSQEESKISSFQTFDSLKFLLDNKNRLILPEDNKKEILKKIHCDLSHPGSKRLYMTIYKFVTAKNLKKEIELITNSCHECQLNKDSKQKTGLHTGYIYSTKPFNFISSDIFGPVKTKHFNTTIKSEFFYILTFTDICSRFTTLFILKDIKSDSIIKNFKKWLEKYPKPEKFLSDLGKNYVSRKFENFLNDNGITHIKTSPYNPTANGISERINYSIANILRMNKGKSLKDIVKKIEVHLNLTHHTILNASPLEFINKFSVFDPLARDLSNNLAGVKIREKNKKESEMKRKNKLRCEIKLNVGDKVLRRNVVQDKILDRYLGPFEVIKVSEDYGNVWIMEGKRLVRHNVKNLKPYVGGVGCHTYVDNLNNSHKKSKFEKNQKNNQ
ncbi:Transposon Tf2-9 polyprotein, partial [Dictyocoela muelleri]